MGEAKRENPQMRSFKQLREKTLTPAEKKKREEIAKAMERDNPGMDMSKKMAIATATAKRVAEQSLDEKVYASDYNVGAEKSKFGGYTPVVTHKKTGHTMYSAQHSYKKPEHAKGHASAYLNGYQAMGDRHADRKAREYATQNQKHQYVKESLDISEISLDMLTKKISNPGMATIKKANKMDKTKKDLAALKARLAGKPAMAKEAYEDDEPASPDEASMAMRQLGFIEYAAEEVMDHIKSGKEFPEWMQNKLSKLHGQMESLHSALGEHGEDDEEMKEATEISELNKKTLGSYIKKASADVANRSADNARDYATGNRPVGTNKKAMKNMKRQSNINKAVDKMTKEEVANEALSNNMRLISKIKNSGVVKTGSMAKDTKPAPKKEVDEAKRKGAPKMTGDSVAIQRAKDAALNKALGRTKTGRKTPTRTMTSTQRSLASLRNEAVMSADKKPEKFVKPDGTVGIRMVRVDNQVIKKDA